MVLRMRRPAQVGDLTRRTYTHVVFATTQGVAIVVDIYRFKHILESRSYTTSRGFGRSDKNIFAFHMVAKRSAQPRREKHRHIRARDKLHAERSKASNNSNKCLKQWYGGTNILRHGGRKSSGQLARPTSTKATRRVALVERDRPALASTLERRARTAMSSRAARWRATLVGHDRPWKTWAGNIMTDLSRMCTKKNKTSNACGKTAHCGFCGYCGKRGRAMGS